MDRLTIAAARDKNSFSRSGKVALLLTRTTFPCNERRVYLQAVYCPGGLLPPERDVAPGGAHRSLSTCCAVHAELVIERGHAFCVNDAQRTIDIDLARPGFSVGYGVDAHRRADGVACQRRAAVDVVQFARFLDGDQYPTSRQGVHLF